MRADPHLSLSNYSYTSHSLVRVSLALSLLLPVFDRNFFCVSLQTQLKVFFISSLSPPQLFFFSAPLFSIVLFLWQEGRLRPLPPHTPPFFLPSFPRREELLNLVATRFPPSPPLSLVYNRNRRRRHRKRSQRVYAGKYTRTWNEGSEQNSLV